MRDHDLSKLRILVVDDHRHFMTIIRAMLRSIGVRQVFEAADAKQALRLLRGSEFDLALIDHTLGEIDGIELTRMIRSEGDLRASRMPVIMMSAVPERSHVERAINAGVDEFLAKPISPTMLFKRINWLLDNPRSYQSFGPYFGPDRRRHQSPNHAGPERRTADKFEVEDITAAPKS